MNLRPMPRPPSVHLYLATRTPPQTAVLKITTPPPSRVPNQVEAPSTTTRIKHSVALAIRACIPCLILLAGGYAFWILSNPPPAEQEEKEEEQVIRTEVQKLHVRDYDVIVHSNGMVQPHNEVTLSAEVAGQIMSVNPELEVGAYFEKGDLLVEIDRRDYENAETIAEATFISATAAFELASQNFKRLEKLRASNNVSEAEATQALAAFRQAEASLDMASAQLEQAKRDLDRTQIVAPFDGRVRAKSIGVGQSVSPGTPLATVFSIEFAEVRLPVASSELRFLQLPEWESDEPVEIELTSTVGGEGENSWPAHIVRTEGALDINSLDVYAIARVEDPFGRLSGLPPLRIGQPVTARIPGATLKKVVALPRAAVRQLDQVYLVDDETLTLSSRTIEPLWSDREYVVVRHPEIHSGDLLSTTSLVYAPEGAEVEIIPDVELTATTESGESGNSMTN